MGEGGGTGFGSAEIGVDVSVAVDQENVGVVGRREGEGVRGGADSDVGARYRDSSQLPSKTSGKTERRKERGTEVAIETVRNYSGRGKQ